MKKYRRFLIFICLFLVVMSGCAPKIYRDYMDQAITAENATQLETAYEYYKKALESHPGDKQAQVKMQEMGVMIAKSETAQGANFIKEKKVKAAKKHFEKALRYNPNDPLAASYLKDIDELVQKRLTEINAFQSQHKWIEAIQLLDHTLENYLESDEYSKKLEEWKKRGYAYYLDTGRQEYRNGNYETAFDSFTKADKLQSTPEIKTEIENCTNYVNANSYYSEAVTNINNQNIDGAMDALDKAKAIAKDHIAVNNLIKKIMPQWLDLNFYKAMEFYKAGNIEKAFPLFAKIYSKDPNFPTIQEVYTKTKNTYLKQNYINLINMLNVKNDVTALKLAQELRTIDPEYMNTSEIMCTSFMNIYNAFYQKGLHYIVSGNYGKAILAFQSAEKQLAKTALTQKPIEDAWQKIKQASMLKVAFWPFTQNIDESTISAYSSDKIKEHLKKNLKDNTLKNIVFNYELFSGENLSYGSDNSTDINWKLIKMKDCNTVVTGAIQSLKIDKTVNTEWKIRKNTVKKIVENKEYINLTVRMAELRRALNDKHVIVYNQDNVKMSSGDIKDELELIEEKLPGVPQKIEADVTEEIPFQLEKHKLIGHMEIEVYVLSQNGNEIFPKERFKDSYTFEDLVIPPNLTSEIPEEKKGDPLNLPTDSEFKEKAVEYIIQQKIVPALLLKMREYGKEFVSTSVNLLDSSNSEPIGSTLFLNQIEDYFKFLACYEDKGDKDTLPEQIQEYLEDRLGEVWIIDNRSVVE
ncbi:MAG: hypothetical protein HQK77_03170 [Desulfobacterales bacterium]|nr:hypothetical protein [Desulfobacterales bacterium]